MGNEQEQRDRAASAKALFSMLDTTTSGRAKELVKQGLRKRNGVRLVDYLNDLAKTTGVTTLTDAFQLQWTSSDSLKARWVKLMR